MSKFTKTSIAALTAALAFGAYAVSNAQAPAAPSPRALPQDESLPVDLVVPSGEYILEPNHAKLEWSISHLGMSTYHARFTDYQIQLTLDADDIERSSVKVTVNPDSIHTGFPGQYDSAARGFESWDKELGTAERFMNGAQHPEITFQSTSVEQTGLRTATITGDLNFRGVTKEVTLNARFIGQNPRHMALGVPFIGFEAEGEIIRADFGMGGDPLGPTARIYFNGELIGTAAS